MENKMELILRKNKIDSSIVEAYYKWDGGELYAFSTHEDNADFGELFYDDNQEYIADEIIVEMRRVD